MAKRIKLSTHVDDALMSMGNTMFSRGVFASLPPRMHTLKNTGTNIIPAQLDNCYKNSEQNVNSGLTTTILDVATTYPAASTTNELNGRYEQAVTDGFGVNIVDPDFVTFPVIDDAYHDKVCGRTYAEQALIGEIVMRQINYLREAAGNSTLTYSPSLSYIANRFLQYERLDVDWPDRVNEAQLMADMGYFWDNGGYHETVEVYDPGLSSDNPFGLLERMIERLPEDDLAFHDPNHYFEYNQMITAPYNATHDNNPNQTNYHYTHFGIGFYNGSFKYILASGTEGAPPLLYPIEDTVPKCTPNGLADLPELPANRRLEEEIPGDLDGDGNLDANETARLEAAEEADTNNWTDPYNDPTVRTPTGTYPIVCPIESDYGHIAELLEVVLEDVNFFRQERDLIPMSISYDLIKAATWTMRSLNDPTNGVYTDEFFNPPAYDALVTEAYEDLSGYIGAVVDIPSYTLPESNTPDLHPYDIYIRLKERYLNSNFLGEWQHVFLDPLANDLGVGFGNGKTMFISAEGTDSGTKLSTDLPLAEMACSLNPIPGDLDGDGNLDANETARLLSAEEADTNNQLDPYLAPSTKNPNAIYPIVCPEPTNYNNIATWANNIIDDIEIFRVDRFLPAGKLSHAHIFTQAAFASLIDGVSPLTILLNDGLPIDVYGFVDVPIYTDPFDAYIIDIKQTHLNTNLDNFFPFLVDYGTQLYIGLGFHNDILRIVYGTITMGSPAPIAGSAIVHDSLVCLNGGEPDPALIDAAARQASADEALTNSLIDPYTHIGVKTATNYPIICPEVTTFGKVGAFLTDIKNDINIIRADRGFQKINLSEKWHLVEAAFESLINGTDVPTALDMAGFVVDNIIYGYMDMPITTDLFDAYVSGVKETYLNATLDNLSPFLINHSTVFIGLGYHNDILRIIYASGTNPAGKGFNQLAHPQLICVMGGIDGDINQDGIINPDDDLNADGKIDQTDIDLYNASLPPLPIVYAPITTVVEAVDHFASYTPRVTFEWQEPHATFTPLETTTAWVNAGLEPLYPDGLNYSSVDNYTPYTDALVVEELGPLGLIDRTVPKTNDGTCPTFSKPGRVCPQTTTLTDLRNDFAEVVQEGNTYRVSRGMAPLVWSDNLAVAAAWHAGDMHDRGYSSHTALDPAPYGGAPWDRAALAGIPGFTAEGISGNANADPFSAFCGFKSEWTDDANVGHFGPWVGNPGAPLDPPEYRTVGAAIVGDFTVWLYSKATTINYPAPPLNHPSYTCTTPL